MEPDDPIQQLLKSTGWSCDDLLQKLQKLKSNESTKNEQSSPQIDSTVQVDSTSQDESMTKKDSTLEDKSTTQKDTTTLQEKDSTSQEDSTTQNNLSSQYSQEADTLNLVTVMEQNKISDSSPKVVSTNDNMEETFSDTDEEESEVNKTNSNIINEIIEDISIADSPKSSSNDELPILDEVDYPNKNEVTEVTVVEVNEEEQKEVTRLQRSDDAYETITIETESSDNEVNKRIDYVEIHPRKKYKLVEKRTKTPELKEKNLPTMIKLVKKLPLSPHASTSSPTVLKTRINSLNQKPYTYILKRKLPSTPENKVIQIKRIKKIPLLPQPVVPHSNTKFQLDPKPKQSSESESVIKTKEMIEKLSPSPFLSDLISNKLDAKITLDAKMPSQPELISNKLDAKIIHTSDPQIPSQSSSLLSEPKVNKLGAKIILSSNTKMPSQFPPEFISNKLDAKLTPTSDPKIPFHSTPFLSDLKGNKMSAKIPNSSDKKVSSQFLPELMSNKQNAIIIQATDTKLPSHSSSLLPGLMSNKSDPKLIPICDTKITSQFPPKLMSNKTNAIIIQSSDTKLPSHSSLLLPGLMSIKTDAQSDTTNTLIGNKPNAKLTTFVEEKPYKPIDQYNCLSHKSTEDQNIVKKKFIVKPISELTSLSVEDKNRIMRPSISVKPTSELCGKQPIVENIIQPSAEDSDDETHSTGSTSMDTLEDLRNNLKFQLNSLRNRKKNIFLSTTTKLTDNIECNKKLSLLEQKSSENTNENKEKSLIIDHNFYTQSNDLGLVILDVQGGVQLEEPAEDKSKTEEQEDIGVFDQIRKIINKQKYSKSNKDSLEKLLKNKSSDENSFVNSKETEDLKKLPIPKIDEDKIEEKSPFISDTLDEFLTSSELNISYQVPKLGAEDVFREESIKNVEEPLPPMILKRVKEIKVSPYDKMKNKSLIKAKTVAQKRRLFEKQKKRELKILEKKKLKEMKLKLKKPIVEVIHVDKSFVLFNNKKIWVNSYHTNKCLARINCTKEIKDTSIGKPNQRKKWSLLNPGCRIDSTIHYRPGPLSKKKDLQLTGNEKWDSLIKKLPEIVLEVTPQKGKPFCNDVLHRFSSVIGGELNTNTIEFALSMLQTKTESKLESFKFPLKYHNKCEHIIVRRRKSLNKPKIEDIVKPIEAKTDNISDIIEDLIKYVEIKELAPSLIKEDTTEKKIEEKLDKLLSPTSENNVSVFKKPQRKRSKVEYELLRLSCKVVNVEVEQGIEEICKKPYCELGCVCKSLKCEYIGTNHCQKAECMFNCTCPKERIVIYDKLTLPAGTNILSEDAVSRIEDEAKKNLAKVEREFTQTVIHTNNKTIVVGIGNRTKSRRNAKLPAKFSDFIPSTEDIDTDKFTLNCLVSLPKVNLSQITPYCLIHNLYDCHCKGLTLYEETKPIPIDKLLTNRPVLKLKSFKKYDFDTSPEDKIKKLKPFKRSKEFITTKTDVESNSSDSLSPANRPVRNVKKRSFTEDFIGYESPPDCRRVKPVAKKYLKAYKYSDEVLKKDFVHNVTDNDLSQIRLQQTNPDKELTEAELLKQVLVQEKMSEQLKNQSRTKRKQILQSRSEDILLPALKIIPDAAIQRRKKAPVHQKSKILPVFEGEIIVDEQNIELLKKMGNKTLADGYARLLPWVALMNSFHNNTINIWSMIDHPSRLLINKIDKKCPKNYVNIKESDQMTEVILWILKNRLPSDYHEDSLSFILKETKNNFEICGICTKNIIDSSDKQEEITTTSSNIEEKDISLVNDEDKMFYHKDLNGVEQRLILSKENSLQIHQLELLAASEEKSYIWARLPNVFNVCKWRMIFLNSDFTYLVFKKAEYSIRYTDLLSISEYAKKNNCTVSLKNKHLQKGYDHVLFGIYFDGKFTDRVFVGPYFKTQSNTIDNDLETLRYINKTLVSTENFNKMRGKGDYKSGYWLIQSNRAIKPNKTPSTIDLTSETEDKPTNEELYPSLMQKHHSLRIIDAPPRKPEDFNRYIITNIPHFGYLGAFTYPNGEIDVSWPFENKLLRFESETYATAFLQERFSSLLIPVPESFKVTIIVAVTIDLAICKPIDSCVLNGNYICGDFGYCSILSLTEEECQEKVGYPKAAILKMFAKRAQTFVIKKISELANLLNISKNKFGGYDLPNILTMAQREIVKEIKKEQNLVEIKNKLLLEKREKALKLHKLLSQLPPAKRNSENMKFRAIMYNTEPIEIHDSDEESNKADNGNKVFKMPPPLAFPNRPKLKSVLKPLVSLPVNQDTSVLLRGGLQPYTANNPNIKIPDTNARVIKGVKLIKTANGYVLVSNKDQQKTVTLASTAKVVIQDNTVKQISKTFGSISIDQTRDMMVSNITRSDVPPLSQISSTSNATFTNLTNIITTTSTGSMSVLKIKTPISEESTNVEKYDSKNVVKEIESEVQISEQEDKNCDNKKEDIEDKISTFYVQNDPSKTEDIEDKISKFYVKSDRPKQDNNITDTKENLEGGVAGEGKDMDQSQQDNKKEDNKETKVIDLDLDHPKQADKNEDIKEMEVIDLDLDQLKQVDEKEYTKETEVIDLDVVQPKRVNQQDTKEPEVIDLDLCEDGTKDEGKISEVIDLDESEDTDKSTDEYMDKSTDENTDESTDESSNESALSPLSPEFVDLEDVFSEEVDFSKDTDIDIEGEEINKNSEGEVYNSKDKQIEINKDESNS